MMSGPYDNPMNVPPSDQFPTEYGLYENQFPPSAFPRMIEPDTPFEGMAFWYRPESQEHLYNIDESLAFNRGGISTEGSQMDSQTGIKHRRTRSGCFTCRSRRVKCDETRPICDRCRKGNRECEFPNTSTSKRSKQGESRSGNLSATQEDSKLDTIKDESEEEEEDEEEEEVESTDNSSPKTKLSEAKATKSRKQSTSAVSLRQQQRKISSASATGQGKAISPSTEASGALSQPQTPLSSSIAISSSISSSRVTRSENWRNIKPDLRPEMEIYLHFHNEHLTYYHYFFKLDPSDFIHTELIDQALRYEPLLNAVVAFAAYHHTLCLPEDEAQFSAFWKYYCKSIISLRRWLEKHTERTDAVLLTVLQLATFEEYLGDWPNLAIHHRAAYSILTTLYNPTTIMQSGLSRRIFDWYGRFDVIAGIMAVRDASLGREWLSTAQQWYQEQGESDQSNSEAVLEGFIHDLRLVGFDIAHLFAYAQSLTEQSPISSQDQNERLDQIMSEINEITLRLVGLRQNIELMNDANLARAVSPKSTTTEEDEVFDPSIPLFRGNLWPLNFVWIDWYGIELIHKYQSFVFTQKVRQYQASAHELQPQELGRTDPKSAPVMSAIGQLIPPAELTKLATIQCQIYEAIDRCPDAPQGSILGCHASLGLSTVFLPRPPPESNQGYIMWARRKLAQVEQLGYVWPPHFRKQMSQLWGSEEILNWWLPNGRGKKRLLDEIRTVVEDRNKAADEHMERTGRDDGRAGLREIRALFQKLELDGYSSAQYPSSGEAGTNLRMRSSNASEFENLSGTSSTAGLSPGGDDGNLIRGGVVRQKQSINTDPSSLILQSARVPSTSSTSWSDRMSGVWEQQPPSPPPPGSG